MLKPIASFALVACLGGCVVAPGYGPGYGYYGYTDPYETYYAGPYYSGYPAVYGGGIVVGGGGGRYYRHGVNWNGWNHGYGGGYHGGGHGHGGSYGHGGGVGGGQWQGGGSTGHSGGGHGGGRG